MRFFRFRSNRSRLSLTFVTVCAILLLALGSQAPALQTAPGAAQSPLQNGSRNCASSQVAASHSLVRETLTESPSSPISLILNRILLVRAPLDRRKRRNYRGRPRRVKLAKPAAG